MPGRYFLSGHRAAMTRLAGVAPLAVCVSCANGTAAPPRTQAAAVAPAVLRDTMIQADNDRMMQAVLAQVGDRATLPASQVFQNISILRNTPVRTFLVIMNQGYAKALGVRCTHCHVEGNFASDDKRPKRAAREMAVMHRMINDQLQGMQNIELPKPNRFINCSTCHRGMINPLAEPGRD